MITAGHTHTSATPASMERDGNRWMATMFEIARILATEHDLDRMASQLLACLIETLDAADAGLLMLYVPTEDALMVKAAQGYDMTALRQLRLAPGESITGQAFLSGQARLFSTPEATAAAMATMTPANQAIFTVAATGVSRPLSAVALPLTANSARIGVLLLESLRQPRSFTPDDLAFLKPVADLLALSIENARLRDEIETIRSLSEANRLKAEVISTLAHELRTPLTSIKGYSTALLMDEISFSAKTQREFLQIIDEECDVLQDLIHDLLESSVIDAGFLKLELQPVLLARLAAAATEEFAHLSQRHRFVVDFRPDFPIVDADPRRVTQVLRNLLDNAVKYSPNGGLVVVRGEAREAEVVISVADQGEGIAPEHLNRLFEKFFRIKSGLGRHVVGTGLGLPIARTIVESHGGRIWAESQSGRGTTFYFTIPRARADQGTRPEAQNE
jgi:signal transduction histidine kinase